ncbi:MAG: transposase [Verrucomicrobiaceae bacterium]|nr:MAG: transposase [Verrucomicrobiaceae bacterium]
MVDETVRPLLPKAPTGLRGRPRENSRRDLLNGIFYILRTGGAWRFMPNGLPNWKTCYHYFRLWAKLGHWERIHDAIRDLVRIKHGKKMPRLLRSSTARVFEQLANPAYVAMMRARKLQDESDTSW